MSDQPTPPPPFEFPAVGCRVRLTKQQQELVLKLTGRKMDEVVLFDENGHETDSMPLRTPDDITIFAVRQANILNDYDQAYHEYLLALAAWQEEQGKPDREEELAEAYEILAMQDAERMKLFYEREAEACAAARKVAISECKPKPAN